MGFDYVRKGKELVKERSLYENFHVGTIKDIQRDMRHFIDHVISGKGDKELKKQIDMITQACDKEDPNNMEFSIIEKNDDMRASWRMYQVANGNGLPNWIELFHGNEDDKSTILPYLVDFSGWLAEHKEDSASK